METNNKYTIEYDIHYKRSKFNQSLSNLLDNLNSLTQLTFGNNFNHPISGLLDKLINKAKHQIIYMQKKKLNKNLFIV
jgi:hypothetical protein